MSRTFRRKNLKSDHNRVIRIDKILHEESYFGGYYPVRKQYRRMTIEQYNRIMEAKYHSDKEFWGQVPSNFTKMLNKLYRSRMNQRIRKAILDDQLESLVVDKRVNDARWLWC